MLVEYWQQLIDGFFNPQKRLFVGYLFTALVVAVVWLLIVKQVSLRQACAAVLAKKIWWSASSKLDYQMLLINRAIMLFISPLLLAQVTIAGALFLALYEWLPQRPSVLLSWSDGSVSVLFTTVYFIVDDFARFYVHRLMHRWPLLWAFHKTHHSAETLTPLTVLRTHPIESIVFSLRTVVVQSLMIAVFVFFVGERVDLFTVLGASVVVVLFNAIGSNLRHSHVALFYPRWLEKILLSPAQHQVHHSVDEAHHDKNFGVAFSVWDRMFGCFIHSERHKSLVFGLSQSDVSITMNEQTKTQTLNNVYLQPFRESTKVLYKNSRQLLLISREICMKKMLSRTVGVAIVGALLSAVFFSGSAMAAEQVFVYSARKEALIKPILTRFTEETGIVVKLITGKADALLTRLRLEGKASPADVFITVDAGRLQRAKASGVLQALNSEKLNGLVPAHLRDSDNMWFGLSQRARPIFYAKNKVNPAELSTYEALADKKWQGRICFRSSNSVYNQSQVASMMAATGVAATEKWVKSVVANFARSPAGGDTDQLKAVAVGVCDITIANTYYYGRLTNSAKSSDREVTKKVGLFWPNQKDRGTHVNVSGAGITKYARNKANAITLIEFLASQEAQEWYAAVNNEFPVVASVTSSDTLASWGDFKQDSVNLSQLGELNREAVQLMDRGGWK